MHKKSLFLSAIIMFLLLSAPLCSGETAARKYALLIGVDKYTSDPLRYNLEGCENDVDMMRQILQERFQFNPSDIKILKSSEATLENIRKAFREHLIAKAKPGDLVFIHYSGHGTRTKDLNGDEEDEYDEALCPTDCHIADNPPRNLLLDDEVGALLDTLKTDNIIVVLDSCYSGTATKALDIGQIRRKVRFMEPPSGDDFANPGTFSKTALSDGKKTPVRTPIVSSACSPTERAQESTIIRDNREITCGLMIKHLYRTLSEDPSLSYCDAFKKMKRSVEGDNPSQTPQLEGKSITKPFCALNDTTTSGAEKTTSAGAVNNITAATIKSVKGREVILDTGLAAGAEVGSHFTVYDRAGGRTNKAVGEVEVTSCSQLTSSATVINGGPQIAAGCPVQETSRCFRAEKLNLAIVDGASPRGMDEKLKALPYIQITDRIRSADRIIAPLKEEGGFGLYAGDGMILRKFKSKEENTADELVNSLQSAYLIKRMKALHSPDPIFSVKLDLDVDRSAFQINEKIGFNFRTNRDCHLILLHISTEGRISVLFPNSYDRNNRVTKGQVYTVPPFRDGRFLFSYRIGGPPGQEMVQAIASEKLIEPWGSSMAAEDSSEVFKEIKGNPAVLFEKLMQELNKKLGGLESGRSGAVSLPVGSNSGWATDSITYVIQQ